MNRPMRKIDGQAEAYIGTVQQSPGVAMVLSLVWQRGRPQLRFKEEPRGRTPPVRQFRTFHVRTDNLPALIAKLQAAEIASREGVMAALPAFPSGPVCASRVCPTTEIPRARACEAGQ
jgi:hypothetical protein